MLKNKNLKLQIIKFHDLYQTKTELLKFATKRINNIRVKFENIFHYFDMLFTHIYKLNFKNADIMQFHKQQQNKIYMPLHKKERNQYKKLAARYDS